MLLEINSRVWVKGQIGVIVGIVPGGRAVMLEGEEKAFIFNKQEMQAVATDVLPIGTRVKSKHVLTGTVTAYEISTNRVVVESDKKSNAYGFDRQRYAYLHTELEKIPELKIPSPQKKAEAFEMKLKAHYHITTNDGSKYVVKFVRDPASGFILMNSVGATHETLAMFEDNNIPRQLKEVGVASYYMI